MGTELRLTYEPWDSRADVLPDSPASSAGVGIVNAKLRVKRLADSNDPTVKASVDAVIGLLLGATEWLRWYGMSADEVRSKVNAKKANLIASPALERERKIWREIEEPSDPYNRKNKLSKEVLIDA